MRQTACLLVLLLAACAAQEPAPLATPAAEAATSSQPRRAAPPARPTSAATIDAYKREVAQRIVGTSPHVFEGPIQPLLKSIVVLDITIDGRGQLAAVKVRRSNGFRELEKRAMESVRRAAPFSAPPRNGSVNYLETFLFRDDGRFRVRSLVES